MATDGSALVLLELRERFREASREWPWLQFIATGFVDKSRSVLKEWGLPDDTWKRLYTNPAAHTGAVSGKETFFWLDDRAMECCFVDAAGMTTEHEQCRAQLQTSIAGRRFTEEDLPAGRGREFCLAVRTFRELATAALTAVPPGEQPIDLWDSEQQWLLWIGRVVTTLQLQPAAVDDVAVLRLPFNVFASSAMAIETGFGELPARVAIPPEPDVVNDPTPTGAKNGEPPEQFVTLLMMSAMVSRTKRTLEAQKHRLLPTPDILGGNGRPNEWRWSTVKPILERHFKRDLPEVYPADRFVRS